MNGVELETKRPKEKIRKMKQKPRVEKQIKKPAIVRQKAAKKTKTKKESVSRGVFFEGNSLFINEVKENKGRAKSVKAGIKKQKKEAPAKKIRRVKTKKEKDESKRGCDLSF